MAQIHHALQVDRLEREIREQILTGVTRGADALQEIAEHRREALVLVRRELAEVLGWAEDERGDDPEIHVLAVQLVSRDERQGPVDPVEPLEIRVERVEEDRVQQHAGDLRERQIVVLSFASRLRVSAGGRR